MTPGYTPDLMSYLFGSILTVTYADIIALGSNVSPDDTLFRILLQDYPLYFI